jgi:uncharacterized lipoprotein YmbA
LVFSGCSIFPPQKDNSRFYTLGDHFAPDKRIREIDGKTIVINLLLDEIPSYADYPYVVVKSANNELIFSENSRWAEPFGDACMRILLERTSACLNDRAIIVSSMHTIGNVLVCDYRLSIDFDDVIYNDSEKSVILRCVWSLFDYKQRKQIYLSRYSSATPVTVENIDDVIGAMKIALSKLAEDIAEKISQLDIFK